MKLTKQERKAAAELQRRRKRAQATLALSTATLRAMSLMAVLVDHHRSVSATADEFEADLERAMTDLRVTTASKLVALEIHFFAALNVAIEGWLDPKQPAPRLVDADIDSLLAAQHTKTLAQFRNAQLHPSPILDKRFLALSNVRRICFPGRISC